MHTLTARLSLPTAAAVMAAGVIVASPPPAALAALPAPVIHSVQMPDIQLTATIADILEFPAFRQWVVNQVDDALTIGVGLAKAGQGVGQTISAIPGLVVTVAQQILARDLVGALGTVEAGLIGAVTVIGGPILVSVIERNQRQLAVDQALQGAVPAALIGLGAGLLGGFNDVATSAIIAGQNVVAALLPINIGNLVTAVVDGVKLVIQGLNTGAGKVIDGIAFAQNTIANALATQPAPIAATTPSPTSAVAATAIPKITTTKVKAAAKPVPTSATATPTGTKDPTDTKDSTAPDSKPDTTGAATNSNAGSGTSDTGSKAGKQTTQKKPKSKSGKRTQGKKAASTSQAAA
jgi:hypothetical protein